MGVPLGRDSELPSRGKLYEACLPLKVCHKSHITLQKPSIRIIFGGFGAVSPSGDKELRTTGLPVAGGLNLDAACPVWNDDMKALKIAGAAVAAVIVLVAVLLLIVGVPSGFLTVHDPAAGRTRNRLSG